MTQGICLPGETGLCSFSCNPPSYFKNRSLGLQAHTSPEKHCSPPGLDHTWSSVPLSSFPTPLSLSWLPRSRCWRYKHPKKGLPRDSGKSSGGSSLRSCISPGPSPKCRNLMTTRDTIASTEHLSGPWTGINSGQKTYKF